MERGRWCTSADERRAGSKHRRGGPNKGERNRGQHGSEFIVGQLVNVELQHGTQLVFGLGEKRHDSAFTGQTGLSSTSFHRHNSLFPVERHHVHRTEPWSLCRRSGVEVSSVRQLWARKGRGSGSGSGSASRACRRRAEGSEKENGCLRSQEMRAVKHAKE